MALGTRNTNTAMEALRGVLQDLAYVQTMPDADVEFISSVQQMILQKLREPIEALAQGQAGGMAGAGGDMTGAPGLSPFSALPTQPQVGMGGVPAGLRNGGTPPPVDELRRLLGATSGV